MPLQQPSMPTFLSKHPVRVLDGILTWTKEPEFGKFIKSWPVGKNTLGIERKFHRKIVIQPFESIAKTWSLRTVITKLIIPWRYQPINWMASNQSRNAFQWCLLNFVPWRSLVSSKSKLFVNDNHWTFVDSWYLNSMCGISFVATIAAKLIFDGIFWWIGALVNKY